MFLDSVRLRHCHLFKCMTVFVHSLLIKLNVQSFLFLLTGEDDHEGYDINRLRKPADMTRMDKPIMAAHSRPLKCKSCILKFESYKLAPQL